MRESAESRGQKLNLAGRASRGTTKLLVSLSAKMCYKIMFLRLRTRNLDCMVATMKSNHGDSKNHDCGMFLQRRLLLSHRRLRSWYAGGALLTVVILCALAYLKEERPTLKVTTTEKEVDDMLPRWKPGMLDIHHLRVGPSQVRTILSIRHRVSKLHIATTSLTSNFF